MQANLVPPVIAATVDPPAPIEEDHAADHRSKRVL